MEINDEVYLMTRKEAENYKSENPWPKETIEDMAKCFNVDKNNILKTYDTDENGMFVLTDEYPINAGTFVAHNSATIDKQGNETSSDRNPNVEKHPIKRM